MSRVTVQRPDITEVKSGTDEWSKLELDLLAECRLGRAAYLPGKKGLPPDTTDPDRRVRAGLIRYLMLGGCDGKDGIKGARPHPKGVQIMGGWIDGVLDLEGCDTPLDLVLRDCLLSECANLRDARIGALFLPGCAAPKGLHLVRLTTRGDVHLRAGFEAGAMVDLGSARIGGQLSCSGGRFLAAEGRALNCDAARIGADVFLRDGFEARAGVNFVGTEIGGQLACSGGRFLAAKGRALNCDTAQIGASVFLLNGFEARAEVSFRGAEISGQLACNGGRFLAAEGRALNCDAARLGADVFLPDGFEARAEVNFRGAEIGGQLACDGGRFLAAEGRALTCQAARIGTDVFLRDGFEARAGVDFVRANIVGSMKIEGAVLEFGIDLESARIGHGFFWRKVTGARRVVDLTDARVGPLRDDRASWEGVGRLILDGFHYERIDGEMSVTDRIAWLGRARHRARPHAPGVPDYLNGEDFNPQPHLRLADVLRAQGDRNGAARVLVDREMRQRRASWWRAHARLDGTWRAGWLSVQEDFKRPLDFLFWLLVGYGHRPMRALFVSILLVILAAMLAGAAFDAGQFVPNSAVILTSVSWQEAIAAAGPGGKPLPLWLAHAPEAADYETFNRWLYGLDLFLPLDALGQEAAWRPRTGEWLGDLAFYSRTFFQAAGWIITALAAAVLTGLVGRRD
jgi:hypothetical protein